MPWYTTADARRDAEKQSASKNRENSVRDNEGPSMNDMEREYRQLCRIDETPGVRGLAQLGRNAIERVAQLEKELAAAVAERDRIKGDYGEAAHFARHFIRDDPNITPRGAIIRLGDKCTDLFVRLQQAEARLSAIDSAPVVARPKFIRGEICGCQTRPTHYVGEMDCPWHKRGDGQPKEAKD